MGSSREEELGTSLISIAFIVLKCISDAKRNTGKFSLAAETVHQWMQNHKSDLWCGESLNIPVRIAACSLLRLGGFLVTLWMGI